MFLKLLTVLHDWSGASCKLMSLVSPGHCRPSSSKGASGFTAVSDKLNASLSLLMIAWEHLKSFDFDLFD